MPKSCIGNERQRSYASERHFVHEFCDALESAECPWGKLQHVTEFEYIRGRTDVVAVDSNNELIAFELKLVNWLKALDQAYRNTCFTHRSYVVLPEHVLNRAQMQRDDFKRRKVGLCYLNDGEVRVSLPSLRQLPIQPWLSDLATSKVRRGSEDAGRL